MYDIFDFLHILGAIALGYYLILPILLRNIMKLSGQPLEGVLSGNLGTSRIAQYVLIVQLLSGGYLMSKADYAVAWMVVTIVFFLVVAAISGIMNKRIKTALKDIKAGGTGVAQLSTIRTLSLIVCISMLVVIFFMVFTF